MDQQVCVDVVLGKTGADTKVIIEGVDVSRFCRRLRIDAEVGMVTTMELEFYPDVVEVVGEVLPERVEISVGGEQ